MARGAVSEVNQSRPFKYPLYAHQRREWEKFKDAEARALFWQMRSGKSKSVIDTACENFPSGAQAVLILAPNKVHANWIHREFPEHSWMPWTGLAWSSKFKARPWHREKLKEVLTCDDKLAVLAVNNEAVLTEDARKAIRYLVKNKATMLVVDEAHHYRKAGSKRSKRVRPLAKLCPIRRILTGTPTADSPLGLWAMMELVEPGALGFKTFKDYRSYFFIEKPMKSNGRWFSTYDLNESRADELQARLAEWASVVLRKDCKDLPDLIPTARYFELTTGLQMLYDCTKDETGIELERKFGIDLEITTAMKRLAKLQQITSGFLYEDDGSIRDLCEGSENPRMELLIETIREVPGREKHVIWCQFKEDCRRVRERLDREKIPAVEFHGDVGTLERDAAYKLFQGDRRIKAIVCQPAACSEGLDFSAAKRMIWYSHTWRLTHRDQANERCTKVGRHDVEVIDLIAQRTVDERILSLLKSKQDVADHLTGSGLRGLLGFLEGTTLGAAESLGADGQGRTG
jgi:SNF2 family DNA or RNA helicase